MGVVLGIVTPRRGLSPQVFFIGVAGGLALYAPGIHWVSRRRFPQ
jgi:hypothetical protein